MRYWKFITYTDGSEYATHERLIDETAFRKYQKAMVEGVDFFVLEDRIIKRKMIKEVVPADDIVREYVESGISLESLGLWENPLIGKSADVSTFAKELSAKMGFGDENRTAAQEEAAKEERKK